MDKQEHSPLPWVATGEDGEEIEIISRGTSVKSFYIYALQGDQGSAVLTAADAALIVRAVNSHAELLAALEALVELDEYEGVNRYAKGSPHDKEVKKARAAIAKAKGA